MGNAEFIRHYSGCEGRVFAFSLHLCRDFHLAEDLVQDAIRKVLCAEYEWRDNCKFETYLKKVIKNTFIDHIRKLPTKNTDLGDLSEMEINQTVENGFDETEFILKQLHSLSHTQYRCMELFLDGYKYVEISEIFNMPLGTIKNLLFNSKKLLQERLSDFRK